MPRISTELTPLAVNRLKMVGRHAVGGVPGLLLQIKSTGTRSWILRTTVLGKRRNYGLGGYPTVSLADARKRAKDLLSQIFSGADPTEDKKAARIAKREAINRSISFEKIARKFLKLHTPTLSNPKAAAQWTSTLETYAFPKIGGMPVSDVTTQDVLRVLEPIWVSKTETASRLRGRIEKVLASAIAQNFRDHPNPARWVGNLDQVLPAPRKISRVEHHPAVAIDDAPKVFKRIVQTEGISARALEFAVLTAARSGEVRGATWSEIDLVNKTWTLPAERMKNREGHRVPLSDRAIELLGQMNQGDDDSYVFVGAKGMLSDMSMTQVLRRMGLDCVPHGFRATFKNWATERQEVPWEVSEMALSHKVGNKTEAAYWRGDLYDKRRNLMQAWADFLGKANGKSKAK